MEIFVCTDMKHFGKILLAWKSFCIDELPFCRYNCLINTKKGELTKDEKSLQLFRKTRKKSSLPFRCHRNGGADAHLLRRSFGASGYAASL